MPRRSKNRSHLTCISLFSGGGGLTQGMLQAGFDVLLATDVEKAAAETFQKNHPNIPFIAQDIRRIERKQVESVLKGRKVDLVCGGPPCQGFSTIGDQNVGDSRNTLFWSFKRVVEWVSPDSILLENVAYIRTQYGGRFEKEIVHAFEQLGYRMWVTTLNAADFGVPQVRKRTFFFGTRLPLEFTWPSPTHGESPGLKKYATVGSAIMDLADSGTQEVFNNHAPLNHSIKVIRRYELIPEGGRLPPPSELPAELRRKNFGNTYKRLHRDRPALTLVPGNNAFPVHPVLNRSLTPREAARLQTFPDGHIFCGNRAEQCKLVGNAVPVLLAESIGRAVLTQLSANNRSAHPKQLGEQAPSSRQLDLFLNPSIELHDTRGPKAISFFSGAGGLMLGFINAGFHVISSYDRKNVVDKNFRINFPSIRHFHEDVNELSSCKVREQSGTAQVDVVFGGSPCQGFSIFGRRRFVNTKGLRSEDDPRNELAIKFVKLACELNPKVIVFENVKGLVSAPRGQSTYLQTMLGVLEAHGYSAENRILNCADFGVPQLRERFILVAFRRNLRFVWPESKYSANPRPWQRPYVTVGDVITDLIDDRTISESFSHVPMHHKPMVVERYKLIPEGGKLPEKDLPKHLRKGYRSDEVKNFSHVYRRLSMDKPATTMVPGHNAFPVHPVLPRTLTVREAARIQTFPDWMRFVGTRQQQCLLVGNAVPPLLASILAQSVKKTIDGVYDDPGYKRDIYDLQSAGAQA